MKIALCGRPQAVDHEVLRYRISKLGTVAVKRPASDGHLDQPLTEIKNTRGRANATAVARRIDSIHGSDNLLGAVVVLHD